MRQERPELQLDCAHFGHILALVVKAKGDLILVGDLLRSITVLKYAPPTSTLPNSSQSTSGTGTEHDHGTLVEIARDFNVNSMRAVEFFHNSNFYLGSEDFGNIFIAKRQIDTNTGSSGGINTVTPEEKGRLLINTEYHLGDSVNVLRPGTLNSQPKDSLSLYSNNIQQNQNINVSSTGNREENLTNCNTDDIATNSMYQSVMYGTVNGAIGSIIAIPPHVYTFYAALETAIRAVIQCVGGFSHSEFRSLYNGRRNGTQANSIDGDLIEMFMVLSSSDMKKIVLHLNNDLRAVKTRNMNKSTTASIVSGGITVSNVQGSVLSGSLWNSGAAEYVGKEDEYTVEEVISRIEGMLRLH